MSPAADLLSRMRKAVTSRWRELILGILSLVLFVGVWWLISWYLQDTGSGLKPFVPPPDSVGDALYGSFSSLPGLDRYTMWDLMESSLTRVVLGFFVAVLLAFPLGLLMGSSRIAEYMGKPLVEMFRPIPPLAWVPVFLLAFKAFWGPVAIVFLGAFFPILLNVTFGVKNVDTVLIDAARTLGARKRDIFVKIVVPSIVPYFMTGVKIGLGVAWMCIVAAEYTGLRGGAGLGYYVMLAGTGGQYSHMYATMIVIGILSILTAGAAGILEQRFYKWSGMK